MKEFNLHFFYFWLENKNINKREQFFSYCSATDRNSESKILKGLSANRITLRVSEAAKHGCSLEQQCRKLSQNLQENRCNAIFSSNVVGLDLKLHICVTSSVILQMK